MEHGGDRALAGLLPAVAEWFRRALGVPTPAQAGAWPAIAAGRNALICAPTGSGKTLAAFLACLDHLWRVPREAPGVRILYISPLKALNEDVARNLEAPLAGILAEAERLGAPLPGLSVAVRTGDTAQAERQRLVRKPPDILITTPESLNLMLTSRARSTLAGVSHVVVDEIHALCPNKRGAFLALLLERLAALGATPGRPTNEFVRIGLSATQRPLEEVARYLGGSRPIGSDPEGLTEPRPVAIVDAGMRRTLDLEVWYPTDLAGPPGGRTVWPTIEAQLLEWVENHTSTIIFANNRRVAERLTAKLNERAAEGDAPADEADDGAAGPARAHHGSLSLERRRGVEDALKRGELKAVVATASLELGIDMGAVDLVCQVESPGSVARGLQRVGRAGHVVGGSSTGKLIAKSPADLLETAALARAMKRGAVESLKVPTNALDVLAQQVVACVAVEPCSATRLYAIARRAYPYRDLPAGAFESVLELVSGRYRSEALRDLRPRVSWDRVHNRLHPLPGTAQAAMVGGGTIPDTGQYPVFLGEGGPRLGELDEEFVLERRLGEAFVLGTATWQIESIEPHRVIVRRAEGREALAPFYRGEAASRSGELGVAIGELARDLCSKVERRDSDILDWLRDECALNNDAAKALCDFVARQRRIAGVVPDDRTALVESFRDEAGETGLAVLTPFGGRFHQALAMALRARLRSRLGIEPACLHGDDGLIVRLPGSDDPPTDLLRGLTADEAERLVVAELGESALFGLRFRQAAGRALLMPRPDPGKRTPLWLQRLRAKDLLQAVRDAPDFPIVSEAYRECLADDLDLPRLRAFLGGVADGSVRVVERRGELPSPFAAELVFRFAQRFLYEWDEPRRGDVPRGAARDPAALKELMAGADSFLPWLDGGAVGRVDARLRGAGRPPRTAAEMAERLRAVGDLADHELEGPMAGFLVELAAVGRAVRVELAGVPTPGRWVLTEDVPTYRIAFDDDGAKEVDRDRATADVVHRFLRTRALVGLDDLIGRYPIEASRASELLERWGEEWGLVRLGPGEGDEGGPRWADRRNLEEVRRLSIALKRRESVAVAPEAFADFVLRRQGVHPDHRHAGSSGVTWALETLRGVAATAGSWESEILPRRVADYRPAWLDDALAAGGWAWRAGGDGDEPRVAIVPRDFEGGWPAVDGEAPEISADAERVREALSRGGASFAVDLARSTGLEPSRVRRGLDELARRGLASNDRFDPLRPGGRAMAEALAAAVERRGSLARPRPRMPRGDRPEARWWIWPEPAAGADPDEGLRAWAAALFDRYGVLARETVELDPWAPPWRDLAGVLATAELRGEIRRGYFVEGLSGVQYATDEAAEELARRADRPGSGASSVVLVNAADPANLYGAGAPLDIPLLEGGTARLSRSPAHYLVVEAGRPVLIAEAVGKRLTGLKSASEDSLRRAVALLPGLAGPGRRVLKVESYNGAPALECPASPWLAAAGFVRDPPGMAFYAGW